MIKNFTIMGERCSGTNYLEELMVTNFNIELTSNYGHKHFFGFYDFGKSEEEDDTLFIGIIRHPISWIDSFFREQHHISGKPRSLNSFLSDEIDSVWDNGEIIKEDVNYLTGNKYKNIFELRFMKNYYLLNVMPTKVKNYLLITYETLKKNPIKFLQSLESKYNLNKKNIIYKNVTYYKKEKNNSYKKKNIDIPLVYQLLCIKHLNNIQENKLGYLL